MEELMTASCGSSAHRMTPEGIEAYLCWAHSRHGLMPSGCWRLIPGSFWISTKSEGWNLYAK